MNYLSGKQFYAQWPTDLADLQVAVDGVRVQLEVQAEKPSIQIHTLPSYDILYWQPWRLSKVKDTVAMRLG